MTAGDRTMARRIAGILAFFVVLGGVVFGLGELYRTPVAPEAADPIRNTPDRRSEAGMYEGSPRAMLEAPERPGARTRTLETFYDRRAYPGAPPRIPHPTEDPMAMAAGCLDCHEGGGFTPQFAAYAPVTPHPEYANCRQCHVPENPEVDPWRGNGFVPRERPLRQRAALPGGPPPMPHPVQLRESCHACHAGPAAVPAIKTSHPERLNCRQCHVPQEPAAEAVFARGLEAPVAEAGADPQ